MHCAPDRLNDRKRSRWFLLGFAVVIFSLALLASGCKIWNLPNDFRRSPDAAELERLRLSAPRPEPPKN